MIKTTEVKATTIPEAIKEIEISYPDLSFDQAEAVATHIIMEDTDYDGYVHVGTGSISTKEDWVASYDKEELEHRGMTAEEAFSEDEGVTLIEVGK